MKSVLKSTAVVEACKQAAQSTARSLSSFYKRNRGKISLNQMFLFLWRKELAFLQIYHRLQHSNMARQRLHECFMKLQVVANCFLLKRAKLRVQLFFIKDSFMNLSSPFLIKSFTKSSTFSTSTQEVSLWTNRLFFFIMST